MYHSENFRRTGTCVLEKEGKLCKKIEVCPFLHSEKKRKQLINELVDKVEKLKEKVRKCVFYCEFCCKYSKKIVILTEDLASCEVCAMKEKENLKKGSQLLNILIN